MKRIFEREGKSLLGKATLFGAIVGVMILCVKCEFTTLQDETVIYHDDYNLSISEYFISSPESFSVLANIMEETGLVHLFRTYGDYTFLAPNDKAFNAYFLSRGKSSYQDFEVEELTDLVKYHIFQQRYLSGGFNSGIIESATMSGDYMVSGPTEDGTDVLFNKTARMLIKDEILPNGIVHVVDQVLEKPQKTIYGWMKENQEEYSIFTEALEQTGLDEKFDVAERSDNNFYTCFVTPDSKYKEAGINNFSELAKGLSPNNDNYTDSNNVVNSFIASHFMDEIISMSDAREEHNFFGTVGGATIKFGLRPNSADIVLNYFTSDFPEGLDIDEFNSNNLAANGIIHIMDTMYQVPERFRRTQLLYFFLDVPGLPYDSLLDKAIELQENGLYHNDDVDHRYWPPATVSNHIPFENTNGWLTLNAPYSGGLKFDGHVNGQLTDPNRYEFLLGRPMGLLFGFVPCDDLLDITRKVPYIIPGKYKLILITKTGQERPSVQHYWNGEPIGGIINLAARSNGFNAVDIGIVEVKEEETEHYFREKMVTTGNGFHVAIRLDPVD